MAHRKVTVQQDPENPVETPVLAQAIVDISKAARKLAASGLNRKAVIILVSHDSKRPQSTVRAVLESLESLVGNYT